MGNYDVNDFEDFVMSHMTLDTNYSRSSVSFDIPRIANYVCSTNFHFLCEIGADTLQISEKILFGKVSFSINNFRTPFAFKKDEEVSYQDYKFGVSVGAKLLRFVLLASPLLL